MHTPGDLWIQELCQICDIKLTIYMALNGTVTISLGQAAVRNNQTIIIEVTHLIDRLVPWNYICTSVATYQN